MLKNLRRQFAPEFFAFWAFMCICAIVTYGVIAWIIARVFGIGVR